MMRVASPLRYPGSKARIAEMVAGLLERNMLVGCHLYEPFAGGASVSLSLLANGFARSATWVERDPLVFSFWKMVQEQPEALVERMMAAKISLASWKRLQKLRAIERPNKSNVAELGYAGLFFNRTCFSGIVGAGPIGGMSQQSPYKIDCRFNKVDLAAAIRNCSKIISNVEIIFGDGITILKAANTRLPTHSFAYIDPPYVTNGHKLYRYHFNDTLHKKLAVVIAELSVPWMLSYDNHEAIRNLYIGGQTKLVKTYQSLKGSRFVKEILILSEDFDLPASHNASSNRFRGQAQLMNYESK